VTGTMAVAASLVASRAASLEVATSTVSQVVAALYASSSPPKTSCYRGYHDDESWPPKMSKSSKVGDVV
jgi:hypothetical protein